MKSKRDIEVKICEIENELSKEKAKIDTSEIRVKAYEVSLTILNWVLKD